MSQGNLPALFMCSVCLKMLPEPASEGAVECSLGLLADSEASVLIQARVRTISEGKGRTYGANQQKIPGRKTGS